MECGWSVHYFHNKPDSHRIIKLSTEMFKNDLRFQPSDVRIKQRRHAAFAAGYLVCHLDLWVGLYLCYMRFIC